MAKFTTTGKTILIAHADNQNAGSDLYNVILQTSALLTYKCGPAVLF